MDDKTYLEKCINLARSISNNGFDIPVSAIIIYNEKVISRGIKRFSKGKIIHAEVDAIMKCGNYCDGATLYTTLEPCIYIPKLEERSVIKKKNIDYKRVHSTKYSSCTDYILNSGIKKVVVGIIDYPNKWVNGKGIRTLLNRGIEVKVIDDFKEEIISLSPNYFDRKSLVEINGEIKNES